MFPLCSLFSEMAHELRPHVANHLFANFGGLSCAKHLVANFGGLSPTLLYSTLRYSTQRYPTLPYATICYHTLPYATLSYCLMLRQLKSRKLRKLFSAANNKKTLLYATLRRATIRYSRAQTVIFSR
jgi:hypothetical protein